MKRYEREVGSSPLARGTLSLINDPKLLAGLIPARAGNTYFSCDYWEVARAHPRSRGEHLLPVVVHAAAEGSSPLARGTRFAHAAAVNFDGLIPARAGNTGCTAQENGGHGAHPRSRGEHVWLYENAVKPAGSSPLARGTQEAINYLDLDNGLIPARAGNT